MGDVPSERFDESAQKSPVSETVLVQGVDYSTDL
jgi:hypothetical protein